MAKKECIFYMTGNFNNENHYQTVLATRLGANIDVTALVDAYVARFNRENDWALLWYDYYCDHRFEKNGWKWVEKRWGQVTKERYKVEAQTAKAKAKAEAKAIKERAKADIERKPSKRRPRLNQ